MKASKAEPICWKRVRRGVTVIEIPGNAEMWRRKGRRIFFYEDGINHNAKPIPQKWKEAGVIAVYGQFNEKGRGYWRMEPLEGDLLKRAVALVSQPA